MFVPAVKSMAATASVVLFLNGHHSHISLSLLEEARSNNIHIVCFPPHITHLIQLLDVSVFSPVKNELHKILKMYHIQTRASVLTKEDFQSMLAKLYENSFLPSQFKSGFRKSGLHLLNREAIPSYKLLSLFLLEVNLLVLVLKLSGGQDIHSEQDGDCHSESQSQ